MHKLGGNSKGYVRPRQRLKDKCQNLAISRKYKLVALRKTGYINTADYSSSLDINIFLRSNDSLNNLRIMGYSTGDQILGFGQLSPTA